MTNIIINDTIIPQKWGIFMSYETWLNTFKSELDFKEAYQIDKTIGYIKALDNNMYIKENFDLQNQKALERYNKFIKIIINKYPKEYLNNDFNTMHYNEIISIFKEIIYTLLDNNNETKDIVNDFINLIEIVDLDNPLDGNVLKYLNTNNNNVFYRVLIPKCNNEASIVCLVHEFMHYISFIENINDTKKMYYEEILSIFGEKFAAHLLELHGIEDIERKIENIRVSALKFYYTDQVKELEKYRLFSQKENDDNLYRFYKESKLYIKTLAESYSLGYIYSNSIIELYFNNNSFRKDFISVFLKRLSLQELLDKYSINMENRQVIEQSKKQLRLYFK